MLVFGVELLQVARRVDAGERTEGVLEAALAAMDAQLAIVKSLDEHLIAWMEPRLLQRSYRDRDLILCRYARHAFTLTVKALEPLGKS